MTAIAQSSSADLSKCLDLIESQTVNDGHTSKITSTVVLRTMPAGATFDDIDQGLVDRGWKWNYAGDYFWKGATHGVQDP